MVVDSFYFVVMAGIFDYFCGSVCHLKKMKASWDSPAKNENVSGPPARAIGQGPGPVVSPARALAQAASQAR